MYQIVVGRTGDCFYLVMHILNEIEGCFGDPTVAELFDDAHHCKDVGLHDVVVEPTHVCLGLNVLWV